MKLWVGERPVAAAWFEGQHASERIVIIAQGLGLPQIGVRPLAKALRRRGWGVITLEYYGVSPKQRSACIQTATADDWVDDIDAAIAWARESQPEAFLAMLAHSIGGQLVGQCAQLEQLDGVLLIGAQRGVPHLYPRRSWPRLWSSYLLVLALSRIHGAVPPHPRTLPIHVPVAALRQWVSWGLRGQFIDRSGRPRDEQFARFRGPLHAVAISDDQDAPRRAVDALLLLFSGARIRQTCIQPGELGLHELGHFAPFMQASAWADKIHDWLAELKADVAD